MSNQNHQKDESGFSLVEVLIAWFICSFMMLTVLSLSSQFLRNIHHSYWQTIAINSLQEMLDRLQANRDNAARQYEAELWNQENQYLLPQGYGLFTCDQASMICNVKIYWQEQQQETMEIQALV